MLFPSYLVSRDQRRFADVLSNPAPLTLTIDRRYHGQGLSRLLVVDAAARAIHAEPAIYTLVVDAMTGNAATFYLHLDFRRFYTQPKCLFIPAWEMVRRFVR